MSSTGRRSLDSVRRLLQAARGMYAPSAPPQHSVAETFSPQPVRCFPLRAHHVGNLSSSSMKAPTPGDFHSYLCSMIRKAKRRVNLASLYVGTGTAAQEEEFLNALAGISPGVQVKLLLDENRATRPVSQPHSREKTSSAEAVHQCLKPRENSSDCGLYLFQALHEPRRSLLPSPLNEIAGVFHIKAYIVDDELILSGANLSQEYFFDRQDRYMLFTNGGGGIVDFYADLIEILCEHGYRYQDSSRAQSSTKHELLASLSQLFSGDAFVEESNDIVAYAVPTFQAPEGFFPSSFDFPTDAELTRNLLSTAHEMDSATTVQLASAYLNPTPKLTSTLSVFQRLHLLTAGPKSHGFAPKPNQPRRGDWVPSIFSALYAELETKLPHADFLYYERNGWTFHAKGMWILNGKKSLVAAVVGSGNYGARSEIMDVESNTILVFVDESSDLQMELIAEWKSMCQYAHQGHAVEFPETSWMVKAALSFIRNFF